MTFSQFFKLFLRFLPQIELLFPNRLKKSKEALPTGMPLYNRTDI